MSVIKSRNLVRANLCGNKYTIVDSEYSVTLSLAELGKQFSRHRYSLQFWTWEQFGQSCFEQCPWVTLNACRPMHQVIELSSSGNPEDWILSDWMQTQEIKLKQQCLTLVGSKFVVTQASTSYHNVICDNLRFSLANSESVDCFDIRVLWTLSELLCILHSGRTDKRKKHHRL